MFPDQKTLERTSMNSWDDQKVRDALKANGRNKVIVAGLWTEVCNTTFALCAMLEGNYEIYMVADASGGTSKEAHDYAMQRMVQAGAVPVTWQQVLLEWQRDWAHRDTYDAVMKLVKEHSGAMAWVSTMPTRWSTRPPSARLRGTNPSPRCPHAKQLIRKQKVIGLRTKSVHRPMQPAISFIQDFEPTSS